MALYVIGLVVSSYAITPGQHKILEILVGFGIPGTGFGVILAMVARAASDENRSLTLGIATAAGSAMQIVAPPVTKALLAAVPWQTVFLIFAALVFASLTFLPLLRASTRSEPSRRRRSS